MLAKAKTVLSKIPTNLSCYKTCLALGKVFWGGGTESIAIQWSHRQDYDNVYCYISHEIFLKGLGLFKL